MIAVLFLVAALATSSHGKVYNCTINEAQCTGTGVPSITVNGATMCCPRSASMSVINNECSCEESAANEHRCPSGPKDCREGNSFTTDATGTLRCCLPGYHLTYTATSAPNAGGGGAGGAGGAGAGGAPADDNCMCSLSNSGGFASTFLGLNSGRGGGLGGSMFMSRWPDLLSTRSSSTINNTSQQHGSGGASTVNATEALKEWQKMGEAWKNWGKQFSQGFRNWGRNFAHNMRNTGLDLARDLSGTFQTTLRQTTAPIQRALSDMVGNIFRSIPGF